MTIPGLLQQSITYGRNNQLSLHLDTNSLLKPTSGRRRRREQSSSLPPPPASSTPHQRPRTHTYASHSLSTLTIAPH